MTPDWHAVFRDISEKSSHTVSDSVVTAGADIYQVTSASTKEAWANGVRFSDFDGHTHRDRIKTIIQGYRDLNLPFRWLAGPGNHSAALVKVLVEEGLHLDYYCSCRVRSTQPPTTPPESDVRILAVTPETVPEFVDVSIRGWELPVDYRDGLIRSTSDKLASGEEAPFVAYLDDRAVGGGIAVRFGRFGYLKRSCVDAEFRGRGAYKALVYHRLDFFREQGVEQALLLAKSDSSDPICHRLGFEEVARIHYLTG